MFVDIFSGVYAMINYMSTIFAESGSTLSPNVSAMIVAIVQIAGCYCSTLLVDRAGRKVLMAGSSLAVALGLVIFGCFIKLQKYGYDLSAYDWIPLVSFSFVIFIGNFGIISLPFLVLSEVTPQKVSILKTNQLTSKLPFSYNRFNNHYKYYSFSFLIL